VKRFSLVLRAIEISLMKLETGAEVAPDEPNDPRNKLVLRVVSRDPVVQAFHRLSTEFARRLQAVTQ
jgi:hypothetical protein